MEKMKITNRKYTVYNSNLTAPPVNWSPYNSLYPHGITEDVHVKGLQLISGIDNKLEFLASHMIYTNIATDNTQLIKKIKKYNTILKKSQQ